MMTRKTTMFPGYPNSMPEQDAGTRVLCQHTDKFFYPAKIIKVSQKSERTYTVHYEGWNARYDEDISHTVAIQRFRPCTPGNIEIAENEIKCAMELQKTKKEEKKLKKSDTDESTKKTSRKSSLSFSGKADSVSGTAAEPSGSGKTSQAGQKRPKEKNSATEKPKAKRAATAASTSASAQSSQKKTKKPSKKAQKTFNLANFPENLKLVLMDDYDMISRLMLPVIPAPLTISQIFDDFLTQKTKDSERQVFQERLIHLSNHINETALGSIFYKLEYLIIKPLDDNDRFLLNPEKEQLRLEIGDESGSESSDEDEDFVPQKKRKKNKKKKDSVFIPPERKSNRLRRAATPPASSLTSPTVQLISDDPAAVTGHVNRLGFVHLIRFLYHFMKICSGELRDAMSDVYELVSRITAFTSENCQQYYTEDVYDTCPREYLRHVFDSFNSAI